MKLLGSAKNNITKDKNGENLPHVEITEVLLVHCNIANNDYQHDSRVLYIFIPNKSFGQLLGISQKNFIFLHPLNIYILKYGLLIKILQTARDRRYNKHLFSY